MPACARTRLLNAHPDYPVVVTWDEVLQERLSAADLIPDGSIVIIEREVDGGTMAVVIRSDTGHTALVAIGTFAVSPQEWTSEGPLDWDGVTTPRAYTAALVERLKRRHDERGDAKLWSENADANAEPQLFYCNFELHLRSFTLTGAFEEVQELEADLYKGLGRTSTSTP